MDACRPRYVYDAGSRTLPISKTYKEKLGSKIYGIEPGNDGNQAILNLLKDERFGLKDFNLVESSEQAMLSEVARTVATRTGLCSWVGRHIR